MLHMGLRPNTVLTYQRAMQHFLCRCDTYVGEFFTSEQLDAAMIRYAAAKRRSRAKFGHLYSGICSVLPQFRRTLFQSFAVLQQWRRVVPIQHTLPRIRSVAFALGWYLAVHGYAREGALFILHSFIGRRLRCSISVEEH